MVGTNFYTIDANYLKYLREKDSKVPLDNYSDNHKFFFGLLVQINGFEYFIPVSHFNRPQRTNTIIYDRRGNPISSLRYCFMIPIMPSKLDQVITELDLSDKDDFYINLIDYEERFCLSHLEEIRNKANLIYTKVAIQGNRFYLSNCCNFKKLEEAACSYV